MDCSNTNSLNSYGLVVGGNINTSDTHVHRSIYVAGSGDLSTIQELDQGCIETNTQGTGLVNFDDVESDALRASHYFATFEPSMKLNDDGSLTKVRFYTGDDVEVLTFNS